MNYLNTSQLYSWEFLLADNYSIENYLRATKKAIELEYEERLQYRSEKSFSEFWNAAVSRLEIEGERLTAMSVAQAYEIMIEDTITTEIALFLAIILWVDARSFCDSGEDIQKTWATLARCHFHLGQASGPVTAVERSSGGGVNQARAFNNLRKNVLKTLNDLPSDGFDSVASVIEKIVPIIREIPHEGQGKRAYVVAQGIRDYKESHGRSTNIEALIKKWSRKNSEIRSAMERVVKGGIRPGRKKGSKK